MTLRLEKLEHVHRQGGKILARCPACAETGHDADGAHLVIYERGHFACVVHPGASGKEHRSRIFQLVGDYDAKAIMVRPATRRPQLKPILSALLGRLGKVFPNVVKTVQPLTDISDELVLGVLSVLADESGDKLGRLGRVNQSHARYVVDSSNNNKEFEGGVLSVLKPKRRSRYTSSPEDISSAAELSRWLIGASLPDSFLLSTCERVIQTEVFRARLLLDLTCHHTAMFAPALDRARRVHALFSERNTTHAN